MRKLKVDTVGKRLARGEDVIGLHVTTEKYLDGEVRHFLGTVKDVFIEDIPVGFSERLVVHYFNGEPWPFYPLPADVHVVAPDYDKNRGAEENVSRVADLSTDRDPIILDAMARTLWADVWMDNEEEWGRSAGMAGQDIMDLAPPTPEHAIDKATELYDKIEKASDTAIEWAYERASRDAAAHPDDHRRDVTKDDFGFALAMEALGSGVAWTDNHPKHGLKVPGIDYYPGFPEDVIANAAYEALGGKRSIEASEILDAFDSWSDVGTDELAKRIQRGEAYGDDAEDIEPLKIAHAALLAAENAGIDLNEGRRR